MTMSENLQLLLEGAEPASDSHTFFIRWKFTLPRVRIDGSSGLLMVPMRDTAGNVRNIAYIDILGDATFLHADSDIRGLYYGLTGKKEVIAIAKDFVTGANYHELTGHAVAIAFCAENVPHVAKAMQEKYPTARIFLIEDPNVGMDRKLPVAGVEAAAAIGDASIALLECDRGIDLELSSDSQKLLEWVRRKGLTEFTRTQVLQLGPVSLRTATSAKAALRTLVDKGLLITEDGSGYRVTPAALLSFAEERQDSA
jgi:hypothetical protein